MKARWKELAARFEALSLRERGMVGFAAVAAIFFLVYMMVLEPAAKRAHALRSVMQQERLQMAGIDAELAQRQAAALADPDKESRARANTLKAENDRMRNALRTMQKGLVAPEKIGQLLEQMLQGNKLKLVSLKTLPPRGMSDGRFSEPEADGGAVAVSESQRMALSVIAPKAPAAPGASAAPAAGAATGAKQEELLYRHGVQVVLQGSYLDMVAYMEALERMPAQLFWGKASLETGDYPNARLSLTLYTLSLDTKWIAL